MHLKKVTTNITLPQVIHESIKLLFPHFCDIIILLEMDHLLPLIKSKTKTKTKTKATKPKTKDKTNSTIDY